MTTWFAMQCAQGQSGAPTDTGRYVGRFAPSPTGPLHAGSLVTALASWLDARAHGGTWLVRIEDLDGPRCVPGADRDILATLAAFGMAPDAPPLWQSRRHALYQQALDALLAAGHVYGCACTRREIADALTRLAQAHERHRTLAYSGTCRPKNNEAHGRAPRAWRLRVPDGEEGWIGFDDRWQGECRQHLGREVGDFVLKRADGEWAYQLAVVVDDALQGVSHVVRGADLLDSTARQIWLQRLLGAPTPRYLHVPVVDNANGEKLSKQTGAAPLDRSQPLVQLDAAACHLGLSVQGESVAQWLNNAVVRWQERMTRR